jgi:hypothetical protein
MLGSINSIRNGDRFCFRASQINQGNTLLGVKSEGIVDAGECMRSTT